MKTRIFKRGVSAFLAMLMCLSAFVGIGTTTAFAAGEEAEAIMVAFPRDGDANYDGEWGHGELSFMNGWSAANVNHNTVYAMGSYEGNICYCIEPGTRLETGDRFTQKDETFFDTFPTSYNHTIEPYNVRLLLGRILQYGYTGTITTDWRSQTDGDTMANAFATQILVWETVVGERDENFNHVDTGSYDAILDTVSTGHPLYTQIMSHYNRIVSSVQRHSKVPSFCEKASQKAQTVDLTWDGSQYTATLTDSNNVLEEYSFTAEGGSVNLKVSGNKLIVTSKTAPSGVVTIKANKKNSIRRGLIVWSDGNYQPGVGEQDTISYVQSVNDPVVGYVKLKVSTGSAKIVKTSEDGEVEGIAFTVTGQGFNQTVKTNSKGEWQIDNLNPGTYTVTEQAYDKYEPQESRTVTVVAGKVATVTFSNTLKRGDLTVTKVAEDGLEKEMKFHLFGTSLSGLAVDEYAVVGSDGKAYFQDVLIGTGYTLEEVGTPDRYIVPDDQTADIEWNKVTNKSFDNDLKRGDLTVTKTAEDGLEEGIRFHLFGTSYSGIPVDEYATVGKDGKAYFSDILIGTSYTLEEVDTPYRYVVPKDQTTAIEWNKVTEQSMTNVLKKWNLTVKKSDVETGTAQGDGSLAGAVYGIYDGDELIDRYTTNKFGQFTTKYYLCGEHWNLREISPSEGYLLDTTIYPIGAEAESYTVEYNPLSESVTEIPIKGKVSIIKHTDDGETQIETPEVGAKFELYLKSAGSYAAAKATERDVLTCDENGFAESKLLPYGIYTVHQVSGWEGRELIADFDVCSTSLAQFDYALKSMGYSHQLSPSRKYWTVIPKGYDRPVRLKNLGEDYTNEAIIARLKENQGKVILKPFQKSTVKVRQYKLPTREHKIRKVGGLYGLYLYYCYALGYLPKYKQQNSHRLHYLLRDDLMKLDELTAQTQLLGREKISNAEELFSYRSTVEDEMKKLDADRKRLRNKERTKIDDAELSAVKDQISVLTDRLGVLRKEVKLCDGIAERSGILREKLQTALAEEEKQKGKENRRHELRR